MFFIILCLRMAYKNSGLLMCIKWPTRRLHSLANATVEVSLLKDVVTENRSRGALHYTLSTHTAVFRNQYCSQLAG